MAPRVPSIDQRTDPQRRALLCSAAALIPFVSIGAAGDAPAASTAVGSESTRDVGTAVGTSAPAASATPSGSTAPGAGVNTALTQNIVRAGPSSYLRALRALRPGDTLLLEPGTYDDPANVPGLPIFNLNGSEAQPIIVSGPETGPRPLFIGRATHNTIRLANASYVVIRNVDVDGRDLGGFGVATQGQTHHVTIENLNIGGVGGHQQIVGISTTGWPTWNWTIRRNTIVGAGTGMYLGNSDGTSPFIAGLIEFNVVRDSIGYNVQVKHQLPRPAAAGMPTGQSTTVIRHNVFSKSGNSSTGAFARPNLLVGHFPTSGPGTNDLYAIYGNLFWQNPTEALFQGEGNIVLHANVMANHTGNAVAIQPHNDVPKLIQVFGNTVVALASGISVRGGDPAFTQVVAANAVFAGTALVGGKQMENVVDAYANAADYLTGAGTTLAAFDAYPRAGALRRVPFDPSVLGAHPGLDRDFDGRLRDTALRGAYGSDAGASVWKPSFVPKG